MAPAITATTVWGLMQPTVVIKNTLPRPAFPIKDKDGVDITPISRGKMLCVYDSETAYTTEAASVLNFLRLPTTKSRFMAAKSADDFKAILADATSGISKPEILKFKSPETITVTGPDSPSLATLGSLIGPETAASLNKREVNPFLTLARNILAHNNAIKESIDWLLEAFEESEDEPETTAIDPTSKYSEYIMYAIINIHMRAKLLIAVYELFNVIASVLGLIRNVLVELPSKIQAALRTSSNTKIAKFANDVCKLLVEAIAGILTSRTSSTNYEELFQTCASKILTLYKKTDEKEVQHNNAEELIRQSGGRGSLD